MKLEFKPVEGTFLKTTRETNFPVRRVFCVGRNYEAHAREMGKDPNREPPFFFTKWAETVVDAAPEDSVTIPYPPETSNYHHEAELVVAIGRTGRRISVEKAEEYVFGYAVGLDMTRRDRQLEARDLGRPWSVGKNFENSCPTGRLLPTDGGSHITTGAIHLRVNSELRQSADISDLIWSVPEIITDLSKFYELHPGDLIYTGTPAGVGPVNPGDKISCTIDGLPPMSVTIGPQV
ncbi:MAG: fumarylacetoacetate hydrolase family protein [Pseudomonadota bacterium]